MKLPFTLTRVLMLVVPMTLGALLLIGQAIVPKDGALTGTVVNSATGHPINQVELALSSIGTRAIATTTTDTQGKFTFDHVKPGRYTLAASKAGYPRSSYGAAAIGNPGRALTVRSDGTVTDVEFRLTPSGTIRGKVLNREGEPVPGIAIACGFVDIYGAAPTMEPFKNVTDDKGEYRLADMPPGRYYVQAVPPQRVHLSQATDGVDLPAFYPSSDAFGEAQAIVLAPGQEASGVNITLREGSVFRIRGKVSGAIASLTYSGLDLLLLPKPEMGGVAFGQSYKQAISRRVGGSAAVRQDGTFVLSGVEPGTYELAAVATVQRGQESLGRVEVKVVDRDVEEVVLPLGDFINLSVRVEAENQGAKDVDCSILAYPLEGDPTLVSIMGNSGPDGVFRHDRAIQGKYVLTAKCRPGEWVVKSARFENLLGMQDVLDAGMNLSGVSGRAAVRLVLSKDTGTVVVTAEDGGEPAPGRWVTMIPDPVRPGKVAHEKSGWSGEDGRLVLTGVAPGDYRVYAWQQPSVSASSVNSGFLSRFEAQSSKITVRAGEQAQVKTKTVQP